MSRLSKTHIFLSFVALAALRIALGCHFFDQGQQKIRQGGFDSTGFLNAAKGPFAHLFHSMIPDRDGKIRLCYDPKLRGKHEAEFKRLDTSENGKLESEEIAEETDFSPRFFAEMDLNADGVLQQQEYVSWRSTDKEVVDRLKREFTRLDQDFDATLSPTEYFIGKADLDEDGAISIHEYLGWRRPEPTIKIWRQYKEYVVDQLRKNENELVQRRERTKIRLEKLKEDSDDYFVYSKLYDTDEATILAIRKARDEGAANRIFKKYADLIKDYLIVYEEDIEFYFKGEDRLDGFQRDSEIAKIRSELSKEDSDKERQRIMKSAAKNVGLLRGQIESIQSERKSSVGEWLSMIDGFWTGYEDELLNMVDLEDEQKKDLQLSLPTDSWKIDTINKVIPCFDMTVGLLLIIGLFTRTAAAAGGMFLVSVLMTQPSILGEFAAPTTVLYLIETLAMFVIFATCAGRYAGLDYFVNAAVQKIFPPKDLDEDL